MATLTIGSTANSRPYGVLTVTETATSVANNTSTLTIKLVLKRPSAISSSATKSASCTINGTKYTWSGTIGGSGDKTLISKTQTVAHNTDGSKTISIAASIALDITWSGVALGTISNSGTMVLTNIPRYATVTQSLTAKTETTASIKWVSDSTVDYIWYSTNNGSSWTGINVADGTSGTFQITGLTANTTYQIKTRVRRKDSQLTTDSSALSVTTYNYPYANSMPNFTIGNKLTIGLYNPLGRSVTVNIIGADNSQCSNDTTSGTSISGYNGSGVVNNLYASIPSAQSGTYKVKVTYGSIVTTKTGGTYTVNKTACSPTVGAGSYVDTNSTTIALTGDSSDIVRNLSIVRYTATSLSAKYSASISACSVTVNGNTYNLTISGTTATGGNATIDSGSDVTAVFTVTDSRGLTGSLSVTVSMLDWFNPSAIITLQRHNNYYAETDLCVDANFASINGNNAITITYAATKDGDSSPSVSGTLADNVTSVITLDKDYAWAVVITLTDLLGATTTYTAYISRGLPIFFVDRLRNSVGINCFPQDDESLEVNGVNLCKNIMTRSLSAAITTLTVNDYTAIPLDQTNVIGDKLTASGNGILIGDNVSKVLISGQIHFNSVSSTASRYARIVANDTNDTLGWTYQTCNSGDACNIQIPPILADVSPGDIIYLMYYVPIATDVIGGNTYGGRTSLTVEVVG